MIKARNIKQMMKECARKGKSFQEEFRSLLGVQTKDYPEGRFPYSVDYSKAQVSTEEFSLRDLYEEFIGPVGPLHNPKTSASALTGLREALSPVLPSSFANISAFNQSVGGLIETRLLEAYRGPDYIGDRLVETMPTRVNGGRIIGTASIKAPAQYTKPGEELPAVTETIAYTSKLTGQTFAVHYALRNVYTKEFLDNRHFKDVLIHGESTEFEVWVSQLPVGYVPTASDTFVDAEGIQWVVNKAELATLQTRWHLGCLEFRA